MRRLSTVLFFKLTMLFFIAWPQWGAAQITLTASDLLGQIGSRQVGLDDARFNIPIDVGSPGPNQVWDFRNQMIGDSLFSVWEFLTLDQTVSAGRFPNANMVQRISLPDQPGLEVFSFFNLTEKAFINLGDSTNISLGEIDTTLVFSQNDTIALFPVTYGDTWITTEVDTSGFFPTNATISLDTTLNRVDGWGTVRLPMGDFECLRLRQDVKVTNQTIINGAVFSTSVDSFIQYNWIAKNVFLVASAQSQNGDMNPNFTNAQGFGRLDSLSGSTPSSVADRSGSPGEFALLQNYPNPFNPETVIRYRTHQRAPVELTVYNLAGQRVRHLVRETQPAGNHAVSWDGTDDAGRRVSSGVYVYRLRIGQFTQTKKMIFVQ